VNRYWIVPCCALATACGGNSSTPAAPSGPNQSPSAQASTSVPGPFLAGVTSVTLVATAADPDGDALAYTWSLGDGTTAVGQSVRHVFATEGTFEAAVTVTDARGAAATGRVVVQTRGLTGTWTPLQNGVPGLDATIEHSGQTIVGNSTNECCSHTFAGVVNDPRAVTLVFRFSGCPGDARTFTGTVSPDLNTISLTGPNCNQPQSTFGFTRR
jgi:hypothetical protein